MLPVRTDGKQRRTFSGESAAVSGDVSLHLGVIILYCVSQAAFLRALGGIQAGSLANFRKMKGKGAGASNCIYPAAYRFFEQKRILDNKPKSNARKEAELNFDIAYTSVLKRATKTLFIILEEMNLTWIPVINSWELNERHYGALQGLHKVDVAKQYGEDQVQIWRRSYDTPPPVMAEDDNSHPRFDTKYDGIDSLPGSESLKDTLNQN